MVFVSDRIESAEDINSLLLERQRAAMSRMASKIAWFEGPRMDSLTGLLFYVEVLKNQPFLFDRAVHRWR